MMRLHLPSLWGRLRQAPLPALGLAVIGGVLGLNFIFYPLPFEGLLSAAGVSFTSAAAAGDPQPFLDLAVEQLTLSRGAGVSAPFRLPVALGGAITSPDHPTLQQADSIAMELEGSNALTIRAGDDQTLFVQLRLPRGTKVEVFRLDSATGFLAFRLVPMQDGSRSTPALNITPGLEPLALELASAAALKQPPPKTDGPVSFQLQTTEFTLQLPSATTLQLKLRQPLSGPLLHPALAVKDVTFQESIQQEFSDVPVIRSTLTGGELRMAHQDPFKLRADQFLQLGPPGIEEFSVVQQAPTSANVAAAPLSIGVVGHTSAISAGLSARHPVASARASVLSRWLNPTQLAAMNGFLGGIASGLVMALLRKS